VLLYCHHDDWDLEKTYAVELEVQNLPFKGPARLRHYRIDREHSNAYAEWVRQGRPDWPQHGQYDAIKARDALELYAPDQALPTADGSLKARFEMPVRAVSLLLITKA